MDRRVLLGGCLLAPVARAGPETLRIAVIYRHLVAWTAARLMRKVFEQAGFGLVEMELPSARAELLMQRGEVDGEAARIPAYGRLNPELLRIDPPVYRISIHAYTLRRRKLQVGGLAALQSLTVGYQAAIVYAMELARRLPRTEAVQQPVNLYRMLEVGRVDAVIDASLNARRRAALFGLQADESPPLAQHDVHIFLRPERTVQAQMLSTALRALTASGELVALTKQTEAIAMHLPAEFD